MTRRIRSKPESAIAQAVEELKSRFEYPDIDLDPLPFELAGGGGAPTVVVAASDASDLSKQKADLICPGVNDHQVIQSAIDSMPGFGVGGRVLLTEGTFNCQYGELTADFNQAVTLQGMGHNSTNLNFSGSSGDGVDFSTGGDTICDLWIGDDGSGTGAAIRLHASAGMRADNVLFGNSGAGIRIDNSTSAAREVSITRCFFQNDSIGIDATPSSGLRGLVIVGNQFLETGDDAIRCSGSSGGIVIADNHINVFSGPSTTDGIVITGCIGTVITGNWINARGTGIRLEGATSDFSVTGNYVSSDQSHGIHATGTTQDGIIASNLVDETVLDGVLLEGVERVAVSGNTIISAGNHSIELDGSGHCNVESNQLYLSVTGDTWDGIHLTGDSDQNYIHGNLLDPSDGTPRYGINISDSSCDCNIVVGNALGDPADYGTDALNDAGTDSQLRWPADAVYGDNFASACDTSPSSPTSP